MAVGFLFSESLRGMQTVAEHINEMQKIYEEYGAIFDDLTRSFKEFRTKVLLQNKANFLI